MKLTRVNPTAAFLVALVVVLVGLFAPGALGGLALLALAAGLIYLMTRTWQVQPPAARVFRLLILGLLITAALMKVT